MSVQIRTLGVQDAFLDASGVDATRNIMPASFVFRGVDDGQIVDALRAVTAEHEALRARFVSTDSGYRQDILTAAELRDGLNGEVTPVDLSGTRDPQAELEWLLGEILGDPADVASGPAWRAILATLPKEETVLACGFAHAIIDGASVEVLARHLAWKLGGAAPSTAVTSLSDVVDAELGREQLSDEAGAWWAGQFAGRSEPLAGRWDGSWSRFRVHAIPRFSPAIMEGLQAVARQAAGGSISTVLGAVAALALARVRGMPTLGFTSGQREPSHRKEVVAPLHDHLVVLPPEVDGLSGLEFVARLVERRDGSRTYRAPTRALSALVPGRPPFHLAVNVSPFPEPGQYSLDSGGLVQARPIPAIGYADIREATSVAPPATAILRREPDGAYTGNFVAIARVLSAIETREVAGAMVEIAEALASAAARPLRELLRS